MAEIRFEGVHKNFGSVKVVEDLTLTINDGEFFTFVGPSGCGKSTLLNMIAGLENVTEGRILFDDKPVNDLSPKDRDVAMVFQSYALYPHLSVYENIAFPLRMKKESLAVIDAEVKRAAALLGIGELLARKPKELSGGQRQRVALGRAIVRKPRVFLMDEPLSNLDARLRIETRAELKRLHRELGITTVYVTHDQAEAMGLSDRMAVMTAGEIQQIETPRAVYQKPANLFVAGFIGSPPMNIIECTVTQTAPLAIDCLGIALSPQVERSPGGKTVALGIRPEDIEMTAEKPPDSSVEVTVSETEPAGPVVWVDAARRGVKIKGRARPEENLMPGGRVFLKVLSEKVLVFDPSSGRRL